MKELDVSITDFLISIQCFTYGYLLVNAHEAPIYSLTGLTLSLFLFIGLSSLCGGLVHGFFNHYKTYVKEFLWPCTLILVSLTGFVFWNLTGFVLDLNIARGALFLFSLFLLTFQSYKIFTGERSFKIAIISYAPSVLFAGLSFLYAFFGSQNFGFLYCALGLLFSGLSPAIYIKKTALHKKYFTHNATYHLAVIASLHLYFLGVRRLLEL